MLWDLVTVRRDIIFLFWVGWIDTKLRQEIHHVDLNVWIIKFFTLCPRDFINYIVKLHWSLTIFTATPFFKQFLAMRIAIIKSFYSDYWWFYLIYLITLACIIFLRITVILNIRMWTWLERTKWVALFAWIRKSLLCIRFSLKWIVTKLSITFLVATCARFLLNILN